MTTPETRARLRGLEQQLATPTPAPLDGQTAIPLTWRQEPLWEPPRPLAPPAAAKAAQPRATPLPARIRRHFRNLMEAPARPATRKPARSYLHGRRLATINPPQEYL